MEKYYKGFYKYTSVTNMFVCYAYYDVPFGESPKLLMVKVKPKQNYGDPPEDVGVFPVAVEDLIGNSHNYRLQYDWTMYPREKVRNDPVYNEVDFFDETIHS